MCDCLFCKIIAGEIPSAKVYENDKVFAFADINPQAPVHVLVVPKTHVESMDALTPENVALAGDCLLGCREVAAIKGLTNGYRVVSNCGPDACQSVKHLHFHVLGGEKLNDSMA